MVAMPIEPDVDQRMAQIREAALDAVRPLAATRIVHLGFDADPGPRTISGDAVRLQQVISGQSSAAARALPFAATWSTSNDKWNVLLPLQRRTAPRPVNSSTVGLEPWRRARSAAFRHPCEYHEPS